MEAVESNITMKMTDMQGAIEQIRDNAMDVSTDDGLYSEDEEEEEDKGAVSYEEVKALCQVNDTGEVKKQVFHRQAVAKAVEAGQLTEGELQALVSWRADEHQEKQRMLTEAHRGLVEAGSLVAVDDFVAGAQRAADKITNDAFDQKFKAAQG